MSEKLAQFLAQLDGELSSIRDAARQLLDATGNGIAEENGAFLISRRPKIAPQAYACVLYPGLTDASIDRYAQEQSMVLHDSYRALLRVLNGAHIFELSLYGIPPSMCADPPLLNRSARQPLDIGEANRFWFVAYKPAPSLFYFGGSPFSYNENLGYFLSQEGTITALRVGGATFKTWGTMRSFLEDEIRRNETAFPAHEERLFLFRQELERDEAEKRAHRRSRKRI